MKASITLNNKNVYSSQIGKIFQSLNIEFKKNIINSSLLF